MLMPPVPACAGVHNGVGRAFPVFALLLLLPPAVAPTLLLTVLFQGAGGNMFIGFSIFRFACALRLALKPRIAGLNKRFAGRLVVLRPMLVIDAPEDHAVQVPGSGTAVEDVAPVGR